MRISRLTLAFAAGLCAHYIPAAAQEVSQDQGEIQGAPQSEAQGEAQGEAEPDAASPPQEEQPATPLSLDDLIPSSAVENSESWAADGVANPAPNAPPAVEDVDDLDIVLDPATDPRRLALPEEVAVPDRLEADPQVEALAQIDAPDLVELPELAEVKISDELILAFPMDASLFPEQDRFIDRFRALSTIEALDGGDDTVPQLAARARADEELLVDVLRNYGYYNGEVVRQLSGGRRGVERGDDSQRERPVDTDPQVRFDILPGDRYSFGRIDLGGLSSASAVDGTALTDGFAIKSGDPLYADRIPEEIAGISFDLGENGYPFAEIGEPFLLIDHARTEGDLTVDVEPGGKYVFGEVVSDDPRFLSGRHLSEIARFEPGDTYQTTLQADLRRAVLATGLVSSAVVTPREVRAPDGEEPGEVALDVSLERAPLRTVSGAIGYGTEEGIRLEAGWEHRNLFPPEGALKLRGILGTQEQLASVSFQRNNFGGRDRILTIDAYASDLDTDAIDARTIALRATFERVSNLLFQKQFSWAVGGEVLLTDERNSTFFDTNIPRQEYLIGGLFARATIDGSDDLLDPSRGFRLTGEIAPDISQTQGTTSFYARAGVDATYYQPVGKHVLAGRLHLQSIAGAGVFDIAPSRRLYAGGGGSVRGYAFQAIGPRDDFGNPIGGRSLVEMSAEARIQTGLLGGAVEVVPFVDAGSVSTSIGPDFGVIRVGAGIGVRYKTSFGPIRVDVGVPLNPDEFDSPVAVYVSLGQAF
ncbi:MAG: BamA/TamA family outer membrane protein [Pseudomonadota bacterium]|nr:BamA/TamA family outer membrane protein [Pseudomonadota bacterium]